MTTEQATTAIATVDRQAKLPAVPVTARGLTPGDFEGVWRLSQIVSASGLAPKGLDKPEAAFIAIAHGLEIGLSAMQSLQSIAPINGRPCLWGDALPALVYGSGLCEYIIETFEGAEGRDDWAAVCRAKRKNSPAEVVGRFSVADAKKAGLWNKSGPWQAYSNRMLKVRARAFALRDAFADVLRGLAIAEEQADAVPVVDVTPTPQPQPLTPGKSTFGKKKSATTEAAIPTAAPATHNQPQAPAQPVEGQPEGDHDHVAEGAPELDAGATLADDMDRDLLVSKCIEAWHKARKDEGVDMERATAGVRRYFRLVMKKSADEATPDVARKALDAIVGGKVRFSSYDGD